jgi:hypothetical protein
VVALVPLIDAVSLLAGSLVDAAPSVDDTPVEFAADVDTVVRPVNPPVPPTLSPHATTPAVPMTTNAPICPHIVSTMLLAEYRVDAMMATKLTIQALREGTGRSSPVRRPSLTRKIRRQRRFTAITAAKLAATLRRAHAPFAPFEFLRFADPLALVPCSRPIARG